MTPRLPHPLPHRNKALDRRENVEWNKRFAASRRRSSGWPGPRDSRVRRGLSVRTRGPADPLLRLAPADAGVTVVVEDLRSRAGNSSRLRSRTSSPRCRP